MPQTLRRTSRAAIAILGLWLVASTPGRGDSSKPDATPPEIANPDYELKTALAKTSLTTGEPILLTFILKNTGIREIPVIRAHPLCIYQLEIVNLVSKQRVAFTQQGEQAFKISQEGSRSGQKLKPGAHVHAQIENLADIYELASPGDYSISIQRRVFSQTNPKQMITIRAPAILFKIALRP